MTTIENAARQALETLETISVEVKTTSNAYEAQRQAISALREALEQEPFEYWNAVEGWVKIDEVREHFDSVGCGTIYKTAGEGRVPLAIAQPKQEPVAYSYTSRITGRQTFSLHPKPPHLDSDSWGIKPLYTETPKRVWVGLTDKERYLNDGRNEEEIEYAKAIEAKLKELNT